MAPKVPERVTAFAPPPAALTLVKLCAPGQVGVKLWSIAKVNVLFAPPSVEVIPVPAVTARSAVSVESFPTVR